MELVDIGANLAHDSFDPDRDAVLERAAEAGVATLVVTGSCRDSSHRAAELAADRPGRLYATAGIHPHHARDYAPASLDWIRALAGQPGVVAVGECGLDFFRNFSSHEDQERAFRGQVETAIDLGLPLFLHQRDAHGRFCEILDDYHGALPRAVAHCFTGGPAELRDYLARDFYIGVTGWLCDERRGGELVAAVPEVPADRLLIETDAPYLLPRDLSPKPKTRRNEPYHLAHIASVVARYRETSLEEIAAMTTANARRFFGLPGNDLDDA